MSLHVAVDPVYAVGRRTSAMSVKSYISVCV